VPDTLSKFTVPNTVTRINGGALGGNEMMTSFTVPASVTSLGDEAFRNCYRMENINLPDTITEVGTNVFNNTALTSPVILNAGKILCYVPFGKTSYTIPSTVTEIAGGAFSGCSKISSLTLPNTVTKIGDLAFEYCYSLSKLTIPSSITSIGEGSFLESGITSPIVFNNELCFLPESIVSYTVASNITRIKDFAAYGCEDLSTLTFQNGAVKIGEMAFDMCSSLKVVTIPDSTTDIGYAAFANCNSLVSIKIPKTVVRFDDSIFFGCLKLTIFGEAGSPAQTYAKENKINFVYGPALIIRGSKKIALNNSFINSSVQLVPYQCTIKSVTKNGKPITIPSNKVLSSEAKYVVKTDKTSTQTFVIDKTIPKIILKNSKGKNISIGEHVTGTVSIYAKDTNLLRKQIMREGSLVKWPSNAKLSKKGFYNIAVQDKAGNSNFIFFMIK